MAFVVSPYFCFVRPWAVLSDAFGVLTHKMTLKNGEPRSGCTAKPRVRLTPGRFQTRLVDTITVKGKTEAVRVYEVVAFGEDY